MFQGGRCQGREVLVEGKLAIKVVNIAEVAMFQASKLFEVMPNLIVLAVKEFWKLKLDG